MHAPGKTQDKFAPASFALCSGAHCCCARLAPRCLRCKSIFLAERLSWHALGAQDCCMMRRLTCCCEFIWHAGLVHFATAVVGPSDTSVVCVPRRGSGRGVRQRGVRHLCCGAQRGRCNRGSPAEVSPAPGGSLPLIAKAELWTQPATRSGVNLLRITRWVHQS